MPTIDPVQKELEDIELKLRNARAAAAAPGATEKDKADLKLIEQEHLATQAKAARHAREVGHKSESQPTDPAKKLDKKLDAALKDTFPTSDPVAVSEPAPVKEHDRALPEVEASERQAPEKARRARKSGAGR